MFDQNYDDVIVWVPFIVKKQHLQSPLMAPMPIQPPPPTPVPQIQAPAPQQHPEPLPPLARASSVPNTPQNPMKDLASGKQMKCMLTMAREHGISDVELCQYVGAESLEQITKAQASKFIQKYIE